MIVGIESVGEIDDDELLVLRCEVVDLADYVRDSLSIASHPDILYIIFKCAVVSANPLALRQDGPKVKVPRSSHELLIDVEVLCLSVCEICTNSAWLECTHSGIV